MTLLCKQCNLPASAEKTHLICNDCASLIHISCLKNPDLPGGLLGDVFFKLVCEDCTESNTENVSRDKMPWLTAVVLVIYNLSQQSHTSSRRGFFHWKIHICKYIQDKWKILFSPSVKRKKTWMGTVSGTLTHYTDVFQSGLEQLGDQGWWRLQNSNLTPQQIIELRALTLQKKKEGDLLQQGKKERGTISETKVETETVVPKEVQEEPAWSMSSDSSEMYSKAYVEPSATLSEMLFEEEEVDVELDMTETIAATPFNDLSNPSLIDEAMSQVSSSQTPRTSIERVSSSPQLATIKQERLDSYDSDDTYESDTKPRKIYKTEPYSQPVEYMPMSQFEEVQLLHRMQRAGSLPNAEARRLLRKLFVRHAKRQRNLPLFNLDIALTGYTVKDPSLSLNFSRPDRVLDRFQTIIHNEVTIEQKNQPSFLLRLMGRVEPTSFHSPYTERLLKPFILRDSSVRSPWMQLMNELVTRANKHNTQWCPPVPAPLDYSYIRPQHIAPINSLCREYFWPGIDVTESLQYPDFTCVALYKKLVVGFAFLVPDVAYNESYISFLFVRPEWRRAGIASFMLYHLIQTCMGKDVTLHVSATNPALVLYQKFGFKVEEFVQDFYEKYFPVESKECRHALFLRLSR